MNELANNRSNYMQEEDKENEADQSSLDSDDAKEVIAASKNASAEAKKNRHPPEKYPEP